MMSWRNLLLFICSTILISCQQQQVVASDPDDVFITRLGKSDINEVVEIHQRIVMDDLKQLMIKLYHRNPSGRHDKGKRTIEQSAELFFSRPVHQGYSQWQSSAPVDVIRIALDETYQGTDRVLPFIFGLRKMLMASYNNKTSFYYLTPIEPQKFYNSGRNIEIAAWMLGNNRSLNGGLLLLSDSIEGQQRNLSFQRLIGRMIATQENLALIVSHKTGRIVKQIIVTAGSMVFLPI